MARRVEVRDGSCIYELVLYNDGRAVGTWRYPTEDAVPLGFRWVSQQELLSGALRLGYGPTPLVSRAIGRLFRAAEDDRFGLRIRGNYPVDAAIELTSFERAASHPDFLRRLARVPGAGPKIALLLRDLALKLRETLPSTRT